MKTEAEIKQAARDRFPNSDLCRTGFEEGVAWLQRQVDTQSIQAKVDDMLAGMWNGENYDVTPGEIVALIEQEVVAAKTAPAVAVEALQEAAKLTVQDAAFHLKKYRPHCLEALQAALSAQVQDVAGWQSMDSAPTDGSEFVAGRRYAPDGEFVVHTYKWVGDPNYWSSKRNGVCIRPQYQDDFVWCPLPATKPGDPK